MGNLLQYTDKSKAIDNKLKALLNSVKQDYDNGLIRTEVEYYYRLKTIISDFYKSINKPTFVYRPATTTPISEDYNAMVKESCDDMKYVIDDCLSLSSLIDQSYSDAEMNRIMMLNQVNYLGKMVEKISKGISEIKRSNSVTFSEIFCSSNKDIGYKTIDCIVNTLDGILTLSPEKSSVAVISSIEIDTSVSNGFPGNTHCVDTLSNEIHFLGQSDLHNEITDIKDNNTNTWFEYELINVPEEIKQACGGFGFEYEEGVSWEGDGPLKLKLTLTLNSSSPCSWINLTPYLSETKGVKSCIIEKCDVICSDNSIYTAAVNKPFDEACIISFPSKVVDKIVIIFTQTTWFPVKIGHDYYTEINTKSMSIFENYNTNEHLTRVNGPNPSIGLIGLSYDPLTQGVLFDSKIEKVTPAYAKDNLFSAPSSTVFKQGGQEILDAYRYLIGIKNISTKSFVFNESGSFVSSPHITEQPIDSVILETKEFIPGGDPEIIQYFLSFDGGINWHKIYPTHRAFDGVYRYTINNDSIENLLTTNKTATKSKNLSMLNDIHQVQLKIDLKKPSDIKVDKKNGVENPDYATPIVYNYKLIVSTGGDHIEY